MSSNVERTLRRVAERRGYQISKIRRFDSLAVDYGTWVVKQGDRVVLEGVSLDEVRGYLENLKDLEPSGQSS
jgi:hypothetical protein